MPLVTVTLNIEMDGKSVLGQPLTLSFNATEAQQKVLAKSGADGTQYFGYTQLATTNGFMLMTDTALNIGFNGQSTGLALGPGGLILVLGANMTAGLNLNVLLNNNSGQTATIRGFEYGP